MNTLKELSFAYATSNPIEMKKFTEQWLSSKQEGSSTVTKSLSLTLYEMNLVTEFCKNNSVSVGTLIRVLFLRDGAFPIEFLAGISQQKRMNIDFVELLQENIILSTTASFGADPVKEIKESGFKVKSIPIPVVIMSHMNKWISANKYPSWTGFIRLNLLKMGVIPSILQDHIESSLHEIQQDDVAKVTKQNSASISLSVTQLNQFLWKSLNSFSKNKYNISAGMYFKIVLEKDGIISDELKGKNKLSIPFSIDKLNSVQSAIEQDKNFPGLSLSRENFDKYSSLTPNKNISISISKKNLQSVLDFSDGDDVGLAGLLNKYIFLPMKKKFIK